MYSKQVWHDRKHQVEIYRGEAGEVIGTIVSFRKGICLINPRPDILIALYQEAKIRRIGSVNTILLTDRRPEFVRGLCTFLGYSRKLNRGKPLSVRLLAEDAGAQSFVDSCCMQILRGGSRFEFDLAGLSGEETLELGDAVITVEQVDRDGESLPPFLCIRTSERRIDYYDERYREVESIELGGSGPDVAIRAAELPLYRDHAASRPVGIVARA